MMREFITHRILRRIAKDLDVPREEGLLRANLVASQIAGLIMVRYIVKIEPLATAHGRDGRRADRPERSALPDRGPGRCFRRTWQPATASWWSEKSRP
jgi:hypothetical protein